MAETTNLSVEKALEKCVLTQSIEAAEADIARFTKLYPMNARPVQKLDRRFIVTSGLRDE
jgi:carbonic anhydrase